MQSTRQKRTTSGIQTTGWRFTNLRFLTSVGRNKPTGPAFPVKEFVSRFLLAMQLVVAVIAFAAAVTKHFHRYDRRDLLSRLACLLRGLARSVGRCSGGIGGSR